MNVISSLTTDFSLIVSDSMRELHRWTNNYLVFGPENFCRRWNPSLRDHMVTSLTEAGFHMIADDRRSQTIADDRKKGCVHIIATIAGPTVAIRFGQWKCQIYPRVYAEEQTTWRTWKRRFCCKQTFFFCWS